MWLFFRRNDSLSNPGANLIQAAFPKTVSMVPGHGPRHEPILSVVCKRTFRIAHGKAAVPDEGEILPLHEVDGFLDEGDPLLNAAKHESDLVAFKPLTDVILHACARTPKGKQALFMDVGISIGRITRILRVLGDRRVIVTATGFGFTDPEPFDCMRLDCSRAYGGVDAKSKPGTDLAYPRNPVGKGFITSHAPEALQNLSLPNLEDVTNLLRPQNLLVDGFEKWTQAPVPVFFGYVSRNAHPRYLQAGFSRREQVDAEVSRQIQLAELEEVGAAGQSPPPGPAPLMNPEFFNGAPPGLRFPYLRGDETIVLKNMDAAHADFEFRLAPEKPKPWIDIGNGRQYLNPVLQTVEIFKESNQCTLVWRGSAKYGGPEWFKRYPRFAYGAED
jgi:hypothetical protein